MFIWLEPFGSYCGRSLPVVSYGNLLVITGFFARLVNVVCSIRVDRVLIVEVILIGKLWGVESCFRDFLVSSLLF